MFHYLRDIHWHICNLNWAFHQYKKILDVPLTWFLLWIQFFLKLLFLPFYFYICCMDFSFYHYYFNLCHFVLECNNGNNMYYHISSLIWIFFYLLIFSENESVLVTQLCPALCEPMDRSPPGSSVHGILQARVLEWVAISFSRGSSPPRDWNWVSCITGRFFAIWFTEEQMYWGKLKEQIYWEAVSTNWECIWISLPPVTFPGGASDKEPACQCRRRERHEFNPWVRKVFWRMAWVPHSSIPAWRIPWTEETGWL